MAEVASITQQNLMAGKSGKVPSKISMASYVLRTLRNYQRLKTVLQTKDTLANLVKIPKKLTQIDSSRVHGGLGQLRPNHRFSVKHEFLAVVKIVSPQN